MHGYVEEVRAEICSAVGTQSICREYKMQDSLFGLTNLDILEIGIPDVII
jgi:hypothetical protein